VAFALAGWPLLLAGDPARLAWLVLWTAYGLVVLASAALAALGFRSVLVGVLAAAGMVAVHMTYALGVLRGLLRGS
jgi:hypothetical protein